MKRNIPALLITLATLLPTLALAQPEGDRGPERCAKPEHRHGHPDADFMSAARMPPFLHGIVLSESQKDAIFGILHADAPAVRTHMKAAQQAHEALRALTLSDRYDEAKARELAETAADNMAVLTLLRSHSESRIYQLLTPEQRKQANEQREEAGPHPANLRAIKPVPHMQRAM